MLLPVTAVYAAGLGVIAIVLAAGAGGLRGKANIPVGDGGNEKLLQAMRRHSNFVETVPLALICMAIIELNGGPALWIHGLGAPLLAARIAHPFGIAQTRHPARFFGAAVSALVQLACIVILAWQAMSAG